MNLHSVRLTKKAFQAWLQHGISVGKNDVVLYGDEKGVSEFGRRGGISVGNNDVLVR